MRYDHASDRPTDQERARGEIRPRVTFMVEGKGVCTCIQDMRLLIIFAAAAA